MQDSKQSLERMN